VPTYEYVCLKCDQKFEKYQSMSDAPLKTCPRELCGMKKWGKGRVKKAISAGAGLIFKGSGFYITDYRSENYKAGAKKDSTPAAGGESKASTSSESKPTPAKVESKPAKTPKSKD
jgi:putative FmdB family regulatory protein